MTVGVFNSRGVTLRFAAIELMKNRPKDEFLSIEPVTAERNMMEASEDGAVVFSQSNDNSHLVKAKFRQDSEAHAILSAILVGDLATEGGKGIGPLDIIDSNGVSTFVEPEARIQGWPTKTYGEKADKIMEWVFLCPNPLRFDGGGY
jgi:hypothetical protein